MGRLTAYGDVRRRLFETLYFVKEVVLGSPSDIKAECMRVRLLHAAIRYHLGHSNTGWEVAKVSAANREGGGNWERRGWEPGEKRVGTRGEGEEEKGMETGREGGGN